MTIDTPIIIVDCGSATTKIGFAGEDSPRAVFPTVVGRSKIVSVMLDTSTLAGNEAIEKASNLVLKYPIRRGIISDWSDLEMVLRHAFENVLRMSPGDIPIFLTETPLDSKDERERTVQLMFDTFGASSVYLASQAFMSLYSTGHITGLVVDCGDGVTNIVPYVNGVANTAAIQHINLGGADITEYFRVLLAETGRPISTFAERDALRIVKEERCYVALDASKEPVKPVNCESRIGTITIGKELFLAPELLFKPSLAGINADALQTAIIKAIMKCNPSVRASLFANIIVAGGSSAFPGMDARLQREVSAIAPAGTVVKVTVPPNRKFSAWVGASMLAAEDAFQSKWITADDYAASGPTIVHTKCPA
ncbi:actin-5 [Entophlyctis helioformis]|nr:actin-5 [Entophlyctis helioformis]